MQTNSSPKSPTAADMVEGIEWLNNTGFTDPGFWYGVNSTFDPSDVDTNRSTGAGGQANYVIVGNKTEISLVERSPSVVNWTACINPDFGVFPQSDAGVPTYSVDATGWNASHRWAENRNYCNNTPSVLYKRNYTLPFNLSDYEITAISVDATFNASAMTDSTNSGGIEVPGDVDPTQGAVYDFGRVYLRVSNLLGTNTYELASNTTGMLGKNIGTQGNIEKMGDTHFFLSNPSDILIAYLTNALVSGDYQNLTVIVGIDIHCEKNSAQDEDYFEAVRVKNFNLTFSVEKRINQQVAASWNQDADRLPDNIIVLDARLFFEYKIDTLWPTASPNSEFRIKVNGGVLGETVPLSRAILNWQQAKLDGFQVQLYENTLVNVSIEVYIGDTFLNDNNITVSIDNVHLNITYNTTLPLIPTNPLKLYINGTECASNPSVTVPLGTTVNITVIYENVSSVFIPGATVQLTWLQFSESFDQDTDHDQYTYLLDVDSKLLRGLNYLTIKAVKDGYKLQKQDPSPTITVRKVNGTIASATGSTVINVAPESDAFLNITLYNEDTHEWVKNVSVSFNCPIDSGLLSDIDNDGSYEGTIPNVPEGSFQVTISVLASDIYDWDPTPFTITLNALNNLLLQTHFTLLLNDTDYTVTPVYTIPIYSALNLTVKYINTTNSAPIPGALVTLTRAGLGYTYNFTENYGQYTLLLNSSENLLRGPNNLDLKCRKPGYTSNTTGIQITVRGYETQVISETGSDRIDIKPGSTVTIRISLKNKDLGTSIKGMTVAYSWQFGDGPMTDENGDGIYEVTFEDVPEGSYRVLITVYSTENYEFESFDLTVAAMRTPDEIFIQNMILIIAIAGAVIFGGYFALYQLKWKYPPFVRLIRNVRKDVKKGRKLTASLGIESRTDLVENLIQKDTAIVGIKRKSYLTAVELPAARKTEKPQVKQVEKVADTKKPTSVPPQTKGKVKEKTEKGKTEKGQKPEVKPTDVKPGEKAPAEKMQKPEVKPTDAKPGEKAPAEKMQKPEVKPGIAKLGEKAPAEKSGVEPTKQPEVKPTEVKSEVKPKTENISAETGKKQEAKPAEPKSEVPPTPTESKTQPPSNPAQSPDPKKESKESKPDTNNTKDGK